jgi:hypothetical protein
MILLLHTASRQDVRIPAALSMAAIAPGKQIAYNFLHAATRDADDGWRKSATAGRQSKRMLMVLPVAGAATLTPAVCIQ